MASRRVRIELENFSWHRASARCPTAVFGTKTPPGRAVPRKFPSSSRTVFSGNARLFRNAAEISLG